MSTTNYWNQLSGDSQASPWNQENWAAGAPSQVPGTNPWIDPENIMGEGINPATGRQWMAGGGSTLDPSMYKGGVVPSQPGPWMPQVIDDVTPGSPHYNPNNRYTGSFMDHMKPDERWGQQGFSDAGVGYWSGGRPGAGSWIEQLQAATASPVTPPSDMVRGAPAQIPSRTAPVAENYMINNVQMSPTEPLSNWYLKELAQTQPSSTTSRVKQKLF